MSLFSIAGVVFVIVVVVLVIVVIIVVIFVVSVALYLSLSPLTSPLSLLTYTALRSILENPSSAAQLLNDPEIGPLLMQFGNIVNAGSNPNQPPQQ